MLYNRNVNTIELLGVVLPEPRLFLDFLGYETHVRQIRQRRGADIYPGWYDHATYYNVDLPPEKLFASGDDVIVPACVKAADYEFEIGCYVTESALLTNMQDALEFFKEHCWLTIVNDWSARDVQKKDMDGLGPANSKFIIGKSIGPKFIRASEARVDPAGVCDMAAVLRVNGAERANTNTNTLYHVHPKTGAKGAWSFARIFTFLGQQNIWVHPGYLVGSGTIGNGCIAEFSAKIDPATGVELEPAKYAWLQDGDIVSMEVEGIGILENQVRMLSAK